MVRPVQWACRAAAGVVSLMLLTAVASGAVAASGGPGSLRSADPAAQASTNQVLTAVRGVAAEAGSAYTRSASGPGPTPVGGVQTGFGGSITPATGLSPVVLLTLLLAVTFTLISVHVEVRRRRSAARR